MLICRAVNVDFIFWEPHGLCKDVGSASVQKFPPKVAGLPVPVARGGSAVLGWIGRETAPSGRETPLGRPDDL